MKYPLSNMPQHMVRNAFAKAMRNVKPLVIKRVQEDIWNAEDKDAPDVTLLSRLRALLDGLNGSSYVAEVM